MKAAWLHQAGHPRLLVFFAGWGMDPTPFRRLASRRWDVLVYYDFRCLDEIPCLAELAAYPEMALAAWSLGCAAANRVAHERGWTFSRSVAINGTLVPEDEQAGIPARWIAATALGLADGGWQKFVRRLCPDARAREVFDGGLPGRDWRGAAEELQCLRRFPPPDACLFDVALVSEQDRIILPENQRRCWDRYAVPTFSLPGPHDAFPLWTHWEEVLACSG